MQSRGMAGAFAGLAGGIVFGIVMQMMQAPTPDGGRMSMMAMVAAVVRSDSLLVGWIYHLFNSAVIGALFGVLLGGSVRGLGSGSALGAVWGAVWWVLGALVLMPLLLGMPAFAALRDPSMQPVAWGSLLGHLLFGVILGGVYARLRTPATLGTPARARPV